MRLVVHAPQLAVIAGIACLVSLAGCDRPGMPLDADTLQRAQRETASLTAEAELVSQELSAGDVSEVYARVHRDALLEDVGKVSADVRKPAPVNLREDKEQLEARLAQLARALERAP